MSESAGPYGCHGDELLHYLRMPGGRGRVQGGLVVLVDKVRVGAETHQKATVRRKLHNAVETASAQAVNVANTLRGATHDKASTWPQRAAQMSGESPACPSAISRLP